MRTTLVLIFAAAVVACGDQPGSAAGEPAEDPAFAALQERGAAPEGMGVDH